MRRLGSAPRPRFAALEAARVWSAATAGSGAFHLLVCTNWTFVQSMTAVQKQVYDFIRQVVRARRQPATIREIQEHFRYASPNAAHEHVKALRAEGLLHPSKPGARHAQPITLEEGIPIFGTIPAGIPIDAAAEGGEFLNVSETVFGVMAGTQVFGLRVRGHSMIDAGIHNGDFVILVDRPAQEGDIVAALVDRESTLKRYLMRSGKAFLKAENPAMKDIHPADELLIQGVMIGLVRQGSH